MNVWIRQVRAWIGRLLPGTNYFNRLVWIGCVSVSLPVLLLGGAYYHFAKENLTAQFERDSRVSLVQLKDRVENLLTTIEYQSLQLSVTPALRSVLGQPEFESQYVKQSAILDFLAIYQNASSLIEDIVFYESATGIVLSNSYGASALATSSQRANIERVLQSDKKAGWMYLPGFARDGCISYVRQLPVMKVGKPQGALIFQVSEAGIRQLLFNTRSADGPARERTLLVLDSDNRIMLHSSDASALGQSAAAVGMLQDMIADGSPDGSSVRHDESGARLLTDVYKTALGRTYVSLMPEQALLGELAWLRLLIVFSVLVILLFGLALIVTSSKYAYSPIDQLIRYGEQLRQTRPGKGRGKRGNEFEYIRSCLAYLSEQAESFRRYVRKTQPDLREQLLLRLLLPTNAVLRQSVEAECAAHGLPQRGAFAALIVKADSVFRDQRFLPDEGAIVVFAIKNVMTELLARDGAPSGYAVGRDDREAVAILHFPEDGGAQRGPSSTGSNAGVGLPGGESDGDAAHAGDAAVAALAGGEPADAARRADEAGRLSQAAAAFAADVCEALRTHLSFTVSIGIGSVQHGVLQIADSYRDAGLALQSRFFDDSRQIFRFGEPAPTGKLAVFNYPKNVEVELNEYLLQGEQALAEQALQQFHERIRSSASYNTAMQSYHILLSAIIQSLEEMGYGVLDSYGDNLFEQLKACQTVQEVHEWFVRKLFPMHRRMTEEIRSNSTKLAIQKVCAHIEANQGMPSLIECAELVGLSPSYLSRIFKQDVGISFIEYLMRYKVERAKRLLEETDCSIAEIAERIGYSERNLNRAFQRHVMMSPKQYRLSLR